ncbi:MAG: hypothetical protein VXW87_02305 [Pseudomonadota bacterium]|nr:hypothetical protein [Pseudomonadota bacterium]
MIKKFVSANSLASLLFNPIVGIWDYILPRDLNTSLIVKLTLNAILALTAMMFPIAGLVYTAVFILNTFACGIDSARLAANGEAHSYAIYLNSRESHYGLSNRPRAFPNGLSNLTSCLLHFMIGTLFIIALALIFSLCANPFIPMLITTLIAGVLNSFYIKSVNDKKKYDYLFDTSARQFDTSARQLVDGEIEFISNSSHIEQVFCACPSSNLFNPAYEVVSYCEKLGENPEERIEQLSRGFAGN